MSEHTRTWDKTNVECYRYHKYGHYQYECPKSARKEEQSNYVELEVLLMAYIDEQDVKLDAWYLNSGCSNHMSGNKYLFSDLNKDFREHVKFRDNSSISVMGKGNIQVHIDNINVYTIANVFSIPTLKNNLINIGQLQENRHTITIQSGCYRIRHPRKGLVTKVKMTQNCMFPLHTHKSFPSCFSTKVQDPTWLWYFYFGHLSLNGLKILQQKKW